MYLLFCSLHKVCDLNVNPLVFQYLKSLTAANDRADEGIIHLQAAYLVLSKCHTHKSIIKIFTPLSTSSNSANRYQLAFTVKVKAKSFCCKLQK